MAGSFRGGSFDKLLRVNDGTDHRERHRLHVILRENEARERGAPFNRVPAQVGCMAGHKRVLKTLEDCSPYRVLTTSRLFENEELVRQMRAEMRPTPAALPPGGLLALDISNLSNVSGQQVLALPNPALNFRRGQHPAQSAEQRTWKVRTLELEKGHKASDFTLRKFTGHRLHLLALCTFGGSLFTASKDRTIKQFDLITGGLGVTGGTAMMNAWKGRGTRADGLPCTYGYG